MSKKSDTVRAAPRVLRWAVAVVGALAVSAAVGAAAAGVRDDPAVAFAVLAALTLAPSAGVLALVLGLLDPAPGEQPEHPEDSVEHEWLHRACSGAFLDVVIVLGVAVTITSVLDADPVPLVAVLALAMADVAVRYLVLVRRAA